MSLDSFVDKRRARDFSANGVATPANYAGLAAQKARLAAANPTYWTTARLNATNSNDILYALRVLDDSAGI